jgi:hypothetical protein
MSEIALNTDGFELLADPGEDDVRENDNDARRLENGEQRRSMIVTKITRGRLRK